MEPSRIPTRQSQQAHEVGEIDAGDISEMRPVSEIRQALARASLSEAEPSYSTVDPLEGDALSSSPRHRSEHPCAYDSIAFVEGSRVLTITWLPPAP